MGAQDNPKNATGRSHEGPSRNPPTQSACVRGLARALQNRSERFQSRQPDRSVADRRVKRFKVANPKETAKS
eukprot:9496681-Pyramimonas_sp.AAC.1